MSFAVMPQGPEKYRCAIALLEAFCVMPRPARSVSAVIRKFKLGYIERGEECPASDKALRRWADHGLRIPGVEGAARPFMEIAAEVDGGSDILGRLGAGDGISALLRTKVLDEAIACAGELVGTDEFKAHVKVKPADLTSLLGKLTAAENGRLGPRDLKGMLDELNEGQARDVVEKLLVKHPPLVEEIRQAVME